MLSIEAVEALGGFTEEDLFGLVEESWQTMAEDEIYLVAPEEWPAPEPGQEVAAAVHIVGPWSGSVVLECGIDLARRVACHLFRMTPEEIDTEHIADVVTEMVNIIGGVIKGALDDDCKMSLPEFHAGRDFHLTFSKIPPLADIFMVSGGEGLMLRIIHGGASA